MLIWYILPINAHLHSYPLYPYIHTYIYSEFLQRSASSEVNVSANVQEEIEKDLKSPSRYAFCSAQVHVWLADSNI